MDKDAFKSLLENQMKKATTVKPKPRAKPKAEPPQESEEESAHKKAVAKVVPKVVRQEREGWKDEEPRLRPRVKSASQKNLNRITVNLFDADRRALAVIKELLATEGYDFTSRSDSIKIGLRLAARAKADELVKLFEQVKSEDRRFRQEME
jgi:methylmalonyl-CoA mutase N-terminal domain/subunit